MRKTFRSDAERRRECLLDAANTIFSEEGFNAPLDRIAAEANVGAATFYRNFPNRSGLMAALLERDLARLENIVLQQTEFNAKDMLETVAESLVMNPALSNYWNVVEPAAPVMLEAKRRITRLFEICFERNNEDQRWSPTLTPQDVPLIVSMMGAILSGADATERRALSRRVLDILWLGLSDRTAPPPATAEPGYDADAAFE